MKTELFLVAVILIISSCEKCRQSSKIIEIGGCDIDGYCGVLLENGVITKVYYPVKGQAIPTCHSEREI